MTNEVSISGKSSSASRPLKVALMVRRPRPGMSFSVENIAESLQTHIGPGVHLTLKRARFLSNGVLRRIYAVGEAAARQEEVNHIAGDVHFLTYLLNKQKTVLTILDCRHLGEATGLKARAYKLLWYTIPIRRCAAITVISEAVKQDLLRHERIDPEKVHVVPVAVPSHYTASPKTFNSERPVILQVGTSANKNLPRLIEALEGIPCRLDIVGILTDSQRQLLHKHRIDYCNYVSLSADDMLKRYVECDLVAFASTFEGFGMPIIEANLVGRPVVTSAVTSMPEVAGCAACLVDPYDVASIREGILKVISDEDYRGALVAAGYENALRYNPKRIAAMYESVYRRVATGANGPD